MGKMYIIKQDNNEFTVVRNESVTSPMPSAIKKFVKFDDVLNWLHEDNERIVTSDVPKNNLEEKQ